MSGEFAALTMACGLGVAAVYCPPASPPSLQPDGFRLASINSGVIQRGTTQTFDVMVHRRDGFDKSLTFQVAAPRGIHATVSTDQLEPENEGLIRVTVSVTATVPLGRRTITVGGFHDYVRVTTIPIRLCVIDCPIEE
jgi:hypothetical protein